MIEENGKAKMAAMKAAAQQAKPTNPEKTLGDVIREALARETARREGVDGTETAAASTQTGQCDCPACRAGGDMKIGPTQTMGEGSEIDVTLERYPDEDSFVVIVDGDGASFVTSNDGEQGIMFKSERALTEFITFMTKVTV